MLFRRRRPSIVLPSGLAVSLVAQPDAEPLSSDVVDGVRLMGGRALAALRTGRLALVAGETRLDAAAIDALALGDYHVLRDAAARLGVTAHLPEPFTCRNCDAEIEVDLASLAGIDHFASRFAKDRERRESDRLLLPRTVHLPGTVRVGRRGRASTVLFEPVVVAQAIPLWAALEKPNGWSATPAVVRGLGIARVGDTRELPLIARALEDASDDVWDAIGYSFDRLHYCADLVVPYMCERCGARNDLETPQPRELGFEREWPEVFAADRDERQKATRERRKQKHAERFVDAEELERRVERIAGEVYEKKGVAGVPIRVQAGPAAVDEGGEPLLGSYEPVEAEDGTPDFLITIYYDTFRRMHEEEGPYDLEAELRDTITHEVEHHLAHLAGDDPVDREEQEEIRRELVETYGAEKVRAAEVASALREWGRFLKIALPVVLLFALVVAWLAWSGRL